MFRTLVLLALALPVVTSTAAVRAQETTSRSDSLVIAALEQEVEAAVVRRDTVFLKRTYAPDFRFKHSTGELQDLATWLRAVGSATYHARRIDSLDVDIHGDIALTTGRLHVRRVSDDPQWRQYTIRYARVYRREAGHWLLLTHHSTGQSFGPVLQGAPDSNGPLSDPVPADPLVSSLGLILREVASFPGSQPVPAPTDSRLVRRARINFLGELPDGSGRQYVPDLNGTLYLLQGDTPRVYLDVRTAVGKNFFSGRGLGSGLGFVAFHPDFRKNGKFYTAHTEASDALTTLSPDLTPQPRTVVHGVISEWTADNPRTNTFTGRHRELLRLGFASYIHGIQQIEFNPTARAGDEDYGLLYVAVGDGGVGVSTGDPQNLSVPQGKLLRLDPAGNNSENRRYGIPRVNPFVSKAGTLPEIYAYGMRDPHRFSWDAGGHHALYLAHIGEKDVEAVYEVRPRDNLGWSEREGPFLYNTADRCDLYPLPADDAKYGYTYPVAAYDHNPSPDLPCDADVGHAVSGGFVYRGDRVPALRAKYVFADLVDGRVMYTEEADMRRGGTLATIHVLAIFDESGRKLTMPMLAGDARVDLRIGHDAAGELYLLSKANGKIWQVVGTRTVASPNPQGPSHRTRSPTQ